MYRLYARKRKIIQTVSTSIFIADVFATRLRNMKTSEFLYINVFDIKPSADPFDDEEMAIQTSMEIWAKELR